MRHWGAVVAPLSAAVQRCAAPRSAAQRSAAQRSGCMRRLDAWARWFARTIVHLGVGVGVGDWCWCWCWRWCEGRRVWHGGCGGGHGITAAGGASSSLLPAARDSATAPAARQGAAACTHSGAWRWRDCWPLRRQQRVRGHPHRRNKRPRRTTTRTGCAQAHAASGTSARVSLHQPVQGRRSVAVVVVVVVVVVAAAAAAVGGGGGGSDCCPLLCTRWLVHEKQLDWNLPTRLLAPGASVCRRDYSLR